MNRNPLLNLIIAALFTFWGVLLASAITMALLWVVRELWQVM